jgi:filamentous hemagglutinin family protein
MPHRRIALALLAGCGGIAHSVAATLPVPCLAGSCGGAAHPQTWVSSGSATLVQVGNAMTISQATENAVLNWQSFNISSDGAVTFKQPDAAAVALNQIFQADPSKILGALNANGSVYLINQNGIIFGAGAQVNTGTLLASSLNIGPTAINGILNAGLNNGPAFVSFLDANGNTLPSGPVQVDAGATINAPGGEIMLFGPQVTNQGSLNAAGGQVILAAGDSVYLAASTDPNLRGLLVDVGHGGTVTNAAASSPGGSDYGQITANDGNVTMVGLIVNQLGRVSATTAVQQNGTIYLLAQDGGTATAVTGSSTATLNASNSGTLTLGAGSHTDVTLDVASTATAVDATAQPRSQVTLSGNTVQLASGSEITATSGTVAISASAQPGISPDAPSGEAPESYAAQPGTGRLVIDAGASIDVSGANISLPMSSNVIAVQLRGTELANSPLQRNGPLYGQTVYVDTRQSGVLDSTAWVGSPIGDLSGYVAAIQRTVAQRSLTGGTITLNSDGAVFVAPQATLSLSGGSINYLPGYLDTTKLLGTNGQVYDIAQASPEQTYVGIVSTYALTDSKWGVTQTYPGVGAADTQGQFEAGYVEGKDAGALAIVAPRLVLDGTVSANTVIGPFQRQLPTAFDAANALYRPIDQMPLGGQLTLGLADGGGNGGDDYLLPDVLFASGTVLDTLTGPTGAPFNPLTDPLPATLDTVQIRPGLFGPDGIGWLDLYANGTVTLPSNIALQFPVAGQLTVKAGAIDWAGAVTIHDGSVSLAATTTEAIQGGVGPSTLTLGAGSSIDVSGEWVNDQPVPNTPSLTDPLAIGGGTVAISASGGTPLDLQAGSLINVSGGAQRTLQGGIASGAAGTLSITVGPSTDEAQPQVPVVLGSTIEGYGLKQGGKLSLSMNAICIAAADCSGGQTGLLWIAPSLFSDEGFESIALSSNYAGIDVVAGTQITPQQWNYALLSDPLGAPTGTPFATLAAPSLLPQLLRAPVSLSLTVNAVPPPGVPYFDNASYASAGVLDLEDGAAIALDPSAVLSLNSDTSILINGSLLVPGGSIAVATTTNLPISEFTAAQGIWIGSAAALSTHGVAQLQMNDLGQRIGSVLNGGNLSIAAERGYLITAPGSSIDASGTAADVNLAQYTSTGGTIAALPTLIGSNGGTIALSAAEGMQLAGSLTARAGAAPGAEGGTLAITLDGNLHGGEPGGPDSAPIFPLDSRQIILTGAAPATVAAQSPIPLQDNGIAQVPTATILSGGFSALTLTATNLYDQGVPVPSATGSVVFAQDTSLQLPASIRIDAPQIATSSGAAVLLQAAYVGLGYADSQSGAQIGSSVSAAAQGPATGSLQVQAGLVDFIGTLGLGGFSSSSIQSSGDIRFIGVESSGPTPSPIAGTLLAAGSLVLQAEQVYPTTLTRFEVSVAGAPDNAVNALTILPAGSGTGAVLSAGGQLTLQADTIMQSGVLRAPFGMLVLDAPQITLAPGSVTAVSGAGETIPFGSTQAGIDWVYPLPQGQFAIYTQSGPPAKSVQLNGNSITVASGATINLSGGGDLQASEFVPGVGGTVDVLSNTNAGSPGQFAIVPELSLQFSPYDPQLQAAFSYTVGNTVVLGGGGGVAAGTYAILPASYALLPGAYLVRPVSGFTDLAPGQSFQQLDGSTIVEGQFALAGTSLIDARTQGFDLLPGAQVENLAQYTLTSANSFFSSQALAAGSTAAQLPMDAGQLQFTAGQQLQFLGTLSVAPAPGGRGAQVDISASQIEVTSGTGTAVASGTVALDAAQLNALGAQSLLIGGTRSTEGGETQVTTTASSIVVDPGVTLSGTDLLLTASASLTVASSATLRANGATAAVPSAYAFSGDGTLLRVSSGAQTSIDRTDPNPSQSMGALTIDQGATLSASGSATLEASGALQSQATYTLPGGALSFTASQISLGTAPAGATGLVLSPAQLSTLGLSALALTSRSSIAVYGVNTLAVSGSLTLATPSIVAASPDAGASLQAQQITVLGAAAGGATGSSLSAGGAPSSGSLTLQADQLLLGGGATTLTGFAGVALGGATQIRASANGAITSDAPLTLQTGLISTATNVSFQMTSSGGPLQVQRAATVAQSQPVAPEAGGALTLSGTNVAIDSQVVLPSGVLQLRANGPGVSDGVALGSSASINVAGTSTVFDGVAVAGPGGLVTINSGNGGVTMAAGAQINVSAGGPTGIAGALSVSAPNGAVDLEGTLNGTGGAGASAGQFTLQAGQLPDLASLNTLLNAGGFGGARSFWQLGAGDIVLEAAGLVQANTVSISNDGGSIQVLGSIEASGTTGGAVSLSALNAIDIAGTIDASASGAGQPGGSLALTSTNGLVQLESTAAVNLSGAASAPGGTLNVTVPRTSLSALVGAANGSPAPVSLAGSMVGVGTVQVEGLATYSAANDVLAHTISAADIASSARWYTDAASFMGNAAAIATALQGSLGLPITVVPGIQIQSTGNLTLATNWDLSSWRFDGVPGILTLRAAGNLQFNKSLSDGFSGVTGNAAFVLPEVAGPSWSYRLIAGADLSASNLLSVQSPGALSPGTGNIVLAAGSVGTAPTKVPAPIMIRTGTGSIALAAAGNLQFGNQASVIYTAGENSDAGIPLAELSNLPYPTAGGNIDVNVSGNILGAPTNQLVTSWLWRAGQPPGTQSAVSATGWTVDYQWFEEDIGALGGGNIAISAGGNISQLSVAIPTIGVQTGGTGYAQSAVQVTGGGTLNVQSGGNITGGSYFVDAGTGSLQAEGFVGADVSGAANTTPLAPILALGDASINVTARSGLALESVVNPFLLPQGTSQASSARTQSFFSTYTDASAVSLLSVAGDLTLLNEPSIDGLQTQLNAMKFSSQLEQGFVLYPGTVNAVALSGNLDVDGLLTLSPAPSGELNLLAGQNVVFSPQGSVLMSGLDPTTLANPAAPVQFLSNEYAELFIPPAPGSAYVPIHQGSDPVRVVALDGSVTDATLSYLAKSVDVIAGENISALSLRAQNITSADISLISAGGQISYASPRDVNGILIPEDQSILIEGPGSLLIEAGGNINLGTSGGVSTVGNLYNPDLASGGASVSVLTGATVASADLADFGTRYLADSSTYDAMLISYVQAYAAAPVATKADALALFANFSREQQYLLCEQIFYDEIRTGGRAAAAAGPGHDDYSRSFLALSTLFPNSTTASGPNSASAAYPGSLSLYFSQIYTLDGGDVSLVTPGGSVNVGLATPPIAFGITKSPSQLGIVAESTGNVSSISYGNFLVNQSRVFAADGGDILVWSTDGNVDAGRGAKTAISAPAPTITVNAQGQVQTTFPAALQGSGIQALATTAGATPGDVDLYAPQGVVNASDAGIVAGNLTIGATAVLGRNNITVSGVSVGVPVDTSGLGASFAGSSAVGSSAATAATMAADVGNNKGETAAPLAQSALEFLDVFVLGLGEEACNPQDLECLKRQKPN